MTPTLRMAAIDTLKVDTNGQTTDAVPNEPARRFHASNNMVNGLEAALLYTCWPLAGLSDVPRSINTRGRCQEGCPTVAATEEGSYITPKRCVWDSSSPANLCTAGGRLRKAVTWV
jgi:hypothetical protein